MGSTLLLDVSQWDLVLDAAGDIALAEEPYALAQDAASAAKTFLGEVFWDTTIGVPFVEEIFAHNPSLALLKQRMVEAALTVPGVNSSRFFVSELSNRVLRGQLQVMSAAGVTPFSFSITNPQG